jgi:hypothetical protein
LYRRLDGPQARSGQVRKISPTPEFDRRIVQPVDSRYTAYATRPHIFHCIVVKEKLYNPTLLEFFSRTPGSINPLPEYSEGLVLFPWTKVIVTPTHDPFQNMSVVCHKRDFVIVVKY